mgnify:CR=1 FL=1
MSGRKNTPPVARPTGLRRVIELGKDLLIVALACSAVFLAAQTPIATHLRGWVAPEPPPAATRTSLAVNPYAIAIRNDKGLYSVSYDQAPVERAFERFSPLLGEAFSAAQLPETATRAQWQALLEAPGVCCTFQGQPPLSALSAWLGGGEDYPGEAHTLLLAWDGRQMWLAWRVGDSYFRARTSVAYQGHLADALADFSPNGAAYAYTLSDDDAYEALDPYVLISITAPQPHVYTAASPDLMADEEARSALLTALGFLSGTEGAYETADGLAVTESGDRLLVTSAGEVTFRAGDESRYPMTLERALPSAYTAAQAAWEVLDRAISPFRGEGDFILTGARQTDAGWEVTFHVMLEGVPVLTAGEGWSARFLVEGGRISEFALALRTYTATETVTTLPTPRLAAAALRSLPSRGGQLVLCYSDNRAATLTAGWMTGE